MADCRGNGRMWACRECPPFRLFRNSADSAPRAVCRLRANIFRKSADIFRPDLLSRIEGSGAERENRQCVIIFPTRQFCQIPFSPCLQIVDKFDYSWGRGAFLQVEILTERQITSADCIEPKRSAKGAKWRKKGCPQCVVFFTTRLILACSEIFFCFYRICRTSLLA